MAKWKNGKDIFGFLEKREGATRKEGKSAQFNSIQFNEI